MDYPPVYPKLDRLWQGPAEVLARLSESTYRVNYNGLEQVLPVDRLTPYVPYRDGTRAPLHYFSEREGLLETEDFIVDRVLKHETRGSGANRKLGGMLSTVATLSPSGSLPLPSSMISRRSG